MRLYDVYVRQPSSSVPQVHATNGTVAPVAPPTLSDIENAAGVPEKIASDARYYPFFKDCIGALDGTHLPAHVTEEPSAPWRNRKGWLSQNVLAVVDFEMRFVYVLAGWEGSAHDVRVLDSALGASLNALDPPQGRYYLGDAGYSNRKYLLTPFRGVRYHLKEFAASELKYSSWYIIFYNADMLRRPSDAYELYNLRHSTLRNVVERTFGVFKRRFRLLGRPPEYPIDTQVQLVYACVVIHNFLAKTGELEVGKEHLGDDTSIDTEDIGNTKVFEPVRVGSSSKEMDRTRERIVKAMWQAYSELKKKEV